MSLYDERCNSLIEKPETFEPVAQPCEQLQHILKTNWKKFPGKNKRLMSAHKEIPQRLGEQASTNGESTPVACLPWPCYLPQLRSKFLVLP